MLSVSQKGISVRFVSVSLRNWTTCEELIQALEKKEVRITLDDRVAFDALWERSFNADGMIDTRVALLLCVESLAITEALGDEPTPAHLVVVEKFLRKFEINQKLYDAYRCDDKLSAASKRPLSRDLYALFACMVFQAYRVTSDLRFVNAILKNISVSSFVHERVSQIVAAL
ncbi:MAG: hypothetical protein IT314_02390 [Anaerolineales bacterium]|nr:hypothetical protein [Anaerolineales bacterium]